ncbi:MAG TPA: hypothetical protein VJS65_17095, partial [Verrucomicrobiae bacterium]|nr:hypothetical protein [Verrucomicrobiae bacterium]
LVARSNQPPAEITAATNQVGELTAKVADAAKAAEKATADFKAKAEVVAKLKETAAKAEPPADINDQLTKARAVRESARAVNTSATAALESANQELAKAKAKLAELKKADATDKLAAARLKLERLKTARWESAVYRARERVGELSAQHAAAQAALQAAKTVKEKETSDAAARDSLKKAQSDADTTALQLRKAKDELDRLASGWRPDMSRR